MKLPFKKGDIVTVLYNNNHGHGGRTGTINHIYSSSYSYPYSVKFSATNGDDAPFNENEIELCKNSIVRSILEDL